MFTVKLVRKSRTVVKACDSYEKNTEGLEVLLYSKGATEPIQLQPGDVVYVENAAGRTTDTWRIK